MSDWVETTLGDVVTIVAGGTPSSTIDDYWGGEIPWITPKDLSNYSSKFIGNGERNITDLGLKKSSAKLIPKNSILVTSRAPIGYIAIAKNELTTNQGFKNLILDENSNTDFFYYLMKFNTPQLLNRASGSTFLEISASGMKEVEINLPPLQEQKKIAHILSTLDAKIDLLRRQNETLENMAQTLFKRWFVDFEFPDDNGNPYKSSGGKMIPSELGLIPEGWSVGVLNDFAEFSNGYAFKSSELVNTKVEDSFEVFKMGHIKKGGGFDPTKTKDFFPKAISNKLKKYVLHQGDILMCMTDMKDATSLLGHTALMPYSERFIVNQRVGLIRNRNTRSISTPWIYLLTNSPLFIAEVRSRANSGVQVNLGTNEVRETSTLIPNESVNKAFGLTIDSSFSKIYNNTYEIQTLTKTRDTLLLKLMSGQVRVKELETAV